MTISKKRIIIKVLTNPNNKLRKDLQYKFINIVYLCQPLSARSIGPNMFIFTNILVQESLLNKMFSDNIQLASAPSIFLLNKSDCLLAASYPCLTSYGSSGNAQGLDLNFTSTSLSITTSCLNFGFLAAPSHTF